MTFEISTLMMIFFIIALAISIWKIYAFLPNERLADDDTTKESQQELISIMLNVIKEHQGKIDVNELFIKMQSSDDFDGERYWRFNLNKLIQLLNSYYLKNPNAKSIADIYTNLQ